MATRRNIMAWKNENVEPRAFLFALQMIKNTLDSKGTKFIYDYQLFSHLDTLGIPTTSDVIHALRALKKQRVIDFRVSEALKPGETFSRPYTDQVLADPAIDIRVTDPATFQIIYTEVHGALIEDLSPPPLCRYDEKSGVGYINNAHKFVLNKTYGRLFALLYRYAGNHVTRQDVEDAIRGSQKSLQKTPISTNSINEMVKYLRDKTALNAKQLQQDKGILMLSVRKQL